MDEEMFVSEAFQGLDMAFTNALTSMRKTLWDVFTAKISDFKEKTAELRNECAESFEGLKAEYHNLSKKLEVTEQMLQGKELEIYALRHQIRSLLSGQPVCTNCSQEIIAPEVHILQSNLRLIDDRRPAAISAPRKRTLINASLSSSTTTTEQPENAPRLQSTVRSRPSEKRRCLSDLDNISNASKPGSQTLNKANVLVAETQDLDSEPNHQAVRMQPVHASSHRSSDRHSGDPNSENEASTQSAPTLTNASPAPTNPDRPNTASKESSLRIRMRLASLSPPTQTSFDASEAIRKAVNHHDINNDTTMPRSRLHHRTSTVSGSRDGHHPSKHVHKPSCRYYSSKRVLQHHRDRRLIKAQNSDSDVTGADITLPTEFVASDVTVDVDTVTDMNVFSATEAHPPPSKNPETNSEKRQDAQADDLPSVGGSPSKKGVSKNPLPPNPANDNDQSNAKNTMIDPAQLSSHNSPTDPNAQDAGVTSSDSLKHSTPEKPEKTPTPRKVLKPHPPSPVLRTQTCTQCYDYCRAIGYTEVETRERIGRTGHKHVHLKDVTPSTPKGFWNLTLSSQPNTEKASPAGDDNAAVPAAREKEPDGVQGRYSRSLRRRRPLHFPGEEARPAPSRRSR